MNSKLPNIKIFADGAVIDDAQTLRQRFPLAGFTTNPTLMAKAGVREYVTFAREFLRATDGLPVSFEVFADEFTEMVAQARKLATLGDNVYVKIPVTNTRGEPSYETVAALAESRVKLNITAVFTTDQVDRIVPCLRRDVPAIISIFAGRIADAGVDPVPVIRHAVERAKPKQAVEVLWASCREVFNVVQAAQAGCHIITVPNDMLPKLDQLGKDLTQFSLETVQMFRRDALQSGFNL